MWGERMLAEGLSSHCWAMQSCSGDCACRHAHELPLTTIPHLPLTVLNCLQVNLEELRRVKQLLVELESKAETMRCGGRGRAGQALGCWLVCRLSRLGLCPPCRPTSKLYLFVCKQTKTRRRAFGSTRPLQPCPAACSPAGQHRLHASSPFHF